MVSKNTNDITKIFGYPVKTWVWCLHCKRAYMVGEYRIDDDGLQLCLYEDCDGSPIDAWKWDYKRIGRPVKNKVFDWMKLDYKRDVCTCGMCQGEK